MDFITQQYGLIFEQIQKYSLAQSVTTYTATIFSTLYAAINMP
jgi:hypothetical protein